MRRAIQVLAFGSLILTAISGTIGCTKKAASDKNTLIVAIGATPNSLDPRFATDANGMRISSLIFNSLVRIGPKLEVQGDAAASWTYDNLVYNFHLHPGLTFSNGRPLTPEDVEFSFEQYMGEKSPFQSAFVAIEKATAQTVGDHIEVKLKLKEFSAKLLTSDLPVLKLIPKKEILESNDNFSQQLIGTGSFQFVSQSANEIVLAANKKHPVAPPKVEKVVFKIIRDDFTRFQKTLQGAIDIVQSEIPSGKVASFEKLKDQFQVFKYPGLTMSYVLVNLTDPFLKNPKARQALSYAINRQEIIQYKLEGLGLEATSIISPVSPFYDRELKNVGYSPEKARELFAEAGMLGRELILKTSNNQAAVENGKVIANQLSAAGLKVQLQSFEWGTFYDDVKKGNFQLATMRWVGITDPDIYRTAFHSSEKPPGRNRGSYFNRTLDKLVDEGVKIADLSRRVEHYKRVQKIILNDLPIIPLWYDQQVAIVHRRVKNFTPATTGDFVSLLWVEKQD